MGWRDLLKFGRRAKNEVALATPDVVGDLEIRRDAAAERIATQQEAYLTVGGAMIDDDDWSFRRISERGRYRTRDLTPITQERMLQISWYLFESNAFAKRLIGLMRDLVIGKGYDVSAKDERIQDLITKVWTHYTAHFDEKLPELYDTLSLSGEWCFPVARNPITGLPHLGYIDPLQILRVEKRPDNALIDDYVVLKGDGAGEAEGARMKVVNEDPTTGQLVGECFYLRVNSFANSTRGRSDLLALADWVDLYDQLLFAEVERAKLLTSHVWDLLVKGASTQKQLQDAVDRLGTPKAGTVFVHNESEELNARVPDLKAADRSELHKMLAVHIAGSAGFPIAWMGFPESNRATIEGQNDVMQHTPAVRQSVVIRFFSKILRYAIEGAMSANPSLYRDADPSFEIQAPEIAAKDVARVGAVVGQVVTAMDTAMANKTISRRAAAIVTVAVIKQLGVNLNVDEVLAEADEEGEAQQAAADEKAQLVAQIRAADAALAKKNAGNPPVGEEPAA